MISELKKISINKGYDVFGKEYGFMLRNDLHDIHSVEHKLLQNQIKLDSISKNFLYDGCPNVYLMKNNELYLFSQKFKKENNLDSIKELIKFTSEMASCYDVQLENMFFGGTEKEILERGTDWCFDISRAAAVILGCIGIPSRIVFTANSFKAYHSHVLLETYYEGSWGVIDPLYGYVFYDGKPTSAKDIKDFVQIKTMDQDYQDMFQQIAIAEYDPNNPENKYIISKCNEYTLKINTMKQDGTWLLGENI